MRWYHFVLPLLPWLGMGLVIWGMASRSHPEARDAAYAIGLCEVRHICP